MTVATDEIYEKYLQKAITEINALGDEVAQAGAGTRVPVVGSGPPARRRLPAEVRARARRNSRKASRSTAAPGTRCSSRCSGCASTRWRSTARTALKFADGDEEESRPFLLRELHIVQPKLVVVMGEPALAFLNSRAVPARARARADRRASCRSFTPTIDALFTPDIDEALDEQPSKTRVLERVQAARRRGGPSLPPY